ncbi:MAG: hypothetical protein A4E63_00388 [Syntrophorhabdus sp. PtaU1.Bin050]|nr:MAG: hypothetical protein A4E63_00388 [Syntrophorhabdus sp. PtaU1.Bin050]
MVKPTIKMDVQGENSPEYGLAITLMNTSHVPLTVYHHALPWVGWYSAMVIAVKTDPSWTVLERRFIIDDAGPATTTIGPGETLTGRITLVNRFHGFCEALQEGDMVVFWSYQLQPIDDTPLERVAGHVFFRKSDITRGCE